MADIARSISDFSREGVNLPPNQIEATVLKYQASVPPNFLSFYQNIISMIKQYEEAFTEENFNRMAQYVIAINEALIKYFSNDTSEFKTALNKIGENAITAAKDYVKEKTEGIFTTDEIKSHILDLVNEYKEKILEKVKALTVAKSVDKQESAKQNNSSSNTSPWLANNLDGSSIKTIDTVNEILKVRNAENKIAIQKFSIGLGKTIVTEFNKQISKLTADNLKSFQKSIKQLNNAYANHFYDRTASINRSLSRQQGVFKSAFSKIGKTLKYSTVTVINVVSVSVMALARVYFAGKAILKTFWFWGGKVLGAVGGVLKFGFGLVKKAVRLVFKGIGLVVKGVYNVGKFLVKTTGKILKGVWSISSKIWKKVVGINLLNIFKGTIKAFVFSYPGAYFLGYITGLIWGKICRLAGLSDEDIRNGTYGIKDDVLMPLFEKIKTGTINMIFGKGNSFNDWKEKNIPSKEDIINKIKNTHTFLLLADLYEATKPILDFIKEITYVFNEKVMPFIEKYVAPIIEIATELLSVFTKESKTFFRARTGALIGLSKIKFFTKHVRLKGGIAGLLAGAITIGAGMVFGTVANKKNIEDDDGNLKLQIDEKFWNIYGKPGGTSEDFTAYKTKGQKIVDFLTPLHNELINIDDEDKKREASVYYDQSKGLYIRLLDEQEKLDGYYYLIRDIAEEYNRLSDNGYSQDLSTWKSSNYEIIDDIVKVNDEYLISPKDLDKFPADVQIKFLAEIIAKRMLWINDNMSRFQTAVENHENLDIFENFDKVPLRISEIQVKEGGKKDTSADISLTLDTTGSTLPNISNVISELAPFVTAKGEVKKGMGTVKREVAPMGESIMAEGAKNVRYGLNMAFGGEGTSQVFPNASNPDKLDEYAALVAKLYFRHNSENREQTVFNTLAKVAGYGSWQDLLDDEEESGNGFINLFVALRTYNGNDPNIRYELNEIEKFFLLKRQNLDELMVREIFDNLNFYQRRYGFDLNAFITSFEKDYPDLANKLKRLNIGKQQLEKIDDNANVDYLVPRTFFSNEVTIKRLSEIIDSFKQIFIDKLTSLIDNKYISIITQLETRINQNIVLPNTEKELQSLMTNNNMSDINDLAFHIFKDALNKINLVEIINNDYPKEVFERVNELIKSIQDTKEYKKYLDKYSSTIEEYGKAEKTISTMIGE